MKHLSFLLLFGATVPVFAENWPSWRGPSGLGVSADKSPPLTWSDKEDVRWKAPLPDTGNASPIVWNDVVLITQAIEKGTKRGVICFDRKTGKERWSTYVDVKTVEPTHSTNPYAAATCATDGERIVASLGNGGLLCLDFAGKQLWHQDLGQFIHVWGTASSPIIHDGKAILWCGPGERQFLVAFDVRTGKEIWRHVEPGGKDGLKKGDSWIGSWSTPVIAKIGERTQLVLSVPNKVKGFDPNDGKEIWSCEGLSALVYTSPVVSPDGVVVAMSGYGGPALAVNARDGKGDITKNRLWLHPRNPQRIGSAVVHEGKAYLLNEPGQGSCFDLKTGEDHWKQERVTGQTWSSFVRAGDRLYVTNMGGETLVLKADPTKVEVLAKNRLPDRVLASIAIADGEVYIRGYKQLWCLAAK